MADLAKQRKIGPKTKAEEIPYLIKQIRTRVGKVRPAFSQRVYLELR